MNTSTAPTIYKTWCVAPSGDDTNPGTVSAPFKTIEKARDTVRTVNQEMTGDIVVLLRGGIYPVRGPITLGAEDSGRNGHRVLYKSFPGETPVISGGTPVTEWRRSSGDVWTASVDVENIRQLYVDGQRADRAAIDAPTGLEPWGLHGYTTCAEEIADWSNPAEIEFCYAGMWCHTRCKLASITRTDDGVELRMQQPYFSLANTREGWSIDYPKRIENSLTFLKRPGQWYFDRQAATLHYMAQPGSSPDAAEVIVPAAETLLELKGTLDDPVRHIQFEGVTFAHATWLRPSDVGLVELQANFTLGPELLLFARGGTTKAGCLMSVHCECTKSPANIVCHAAESIRFERCTFTKLGGAGIDIEYGSRNNVISRCEFYDISGTAIQIGDIQRADHHPADPREVVKDNIISNSIIHDAAVDYKGGVGVFVGYTDGTVVRNNEIFDLPYSGISMGWGWGELDAGGGAYEHPSLFDTPTPAGNNIVEHNHIHHVMEHLMDGGAIYTLGEMPGTVIRENHIHDNDGWPSGIYLDEGSGHIEITGNAIYNVGRPMNYNNKAQDRISTCSEHDNFFDINPDAPGFPAAITATAGPS